MDDHPARWRMLALLATAELLGMSLWFAGTAAAPELTVRWNLSSSQVGWLATSVQLGFVVGTALSALLNLADIVPARLLFAVSATAGAPANGWLAGADSLTSALVSRFLAGACLAGTRFIGHILILGTTAICLSRAWPDPGPSAAPQSRRSSRAIFLCPA